MLKNLLVNNIVLIDSLNLEFAEGFCVFTGETGSGKSILLDALNLATGARASSRLLRNGSKQGLVVAEFDITHNLRCQELLQQNAINCQDNQLILRRILTDDGKSKAFVNDIPIGQTLLDEIGDAVLEIHGQHEQRGLLNQATHRDILDAYGELTPQVEAIGKIYDQLKTIEEQITTLRQQKAQAERERDYLEHVIEELEALGPEVGEEESLSNKRALLMNKEKVADAIQNVRAELNGGNGSKSLCGAIGTAQAILSRNLNLAEHLKQLQTEAETTAEQDNIFNNVIDILDQAAVEINEADSILEGLLQELGYEEDNLESIEERLFTLKGLARKFNCQADDLPDFLKDCQEKLALLDNEEVIFSNLEEQRCVAWKSYLELAKSLDAQRRISAEKMSTAVIAELQYLKMNNVHFEVQVNNLSPEHYSRSGLNSVKFLASTNPGSPADNIAKIASGGELSRFMLALKVALSNITSVPTIIFDEIDSGIGGAVADAVGKRLKLLGKHIQILVVTHHPQVASKASYHLCASKCQANGTTITKVVVLSPPEREQEIARMLAGENITPEALANAKKLLEE